MGNRNRRKCSGLEQEDARKKGGAGGAERWKEGGTE